MFLVLNKLPLSTIFSIARFPRGAKFVLSGDPLYLSFSNPIINNLPNVQCAMQCAVMNEINAVWSVTAERNFNLSLLTPSVPPHIKLKVWKSFKNWFPLKLWSFLHFKSRRASALGFQWKFIVSFQVQKSCQY